MLLLPAVATKKATSCKKCRNFWKPNDASPGCNSIPRRRRVKITDATANALPPSRSLPVDVNLSSPYSWPSQRHMLQFDFPVKRSYRRVRVRARFCLFHSLPDHLELLSNQLPVILPAKPCAPGRSYTATAANASAPKCMKSSS